MFAFFKNVWVIGLGLPRLLALIAPIIQIVGSEEFRKMLESVYDAVINAFNQLRKESPEIPNETKSLTKRQRVRVVDRLKRRIGMAWIDMTEDEFVAFENYKNKINETTV